MKFTSQINYKQPIYVRKPLSLNHGSIRTVLVNQSAFESETGMDSDSIGKSECFRLKQGSIRAALVNQCPIESETGMDSDGISKSECFRV